MIQKLSDRIAQIDERRYFLFTPFEMVFISLGEVAAIGLIIYLFFN